jgi:hypothetical protein
MQDFIPRLCHEARIVRGFDSQPRGSVAKSFFDQLELMDTTTFRPLAILLFCRAGIDADRRDTALADLESYLVRRMLAGLTSKNYNNLVAGLIPKIKADGERADEIIRAELLSSTEDTSRWPTDEELHQVMRTQRMYRSRRGDRLVMVLWRIEARRRAKDEHVEQGLAAPENLTLEHILPQSWKDHWPLEDPKDQDAIMARGEHLHRLGNLTLTTGKLNTSISNGPWHAPDEKTDKRRGLAAHILLKLNLDLREKHPTTFDESAIEARSGTLVQDIVELWPRPKSIGP